MPQFTDREDDAVSRAAALARDIAPDIDSILLTHYTDPDTLDTLRPTETDLATVVEVNRAVATELAALGVEIFVQKANRATFRRWMHGRDDTPENRRGWIDRAKLLRGAEALRVLGLSTVVAGVAGFALQLREPFLLLALAPALVAAAQRNRALIWLLERRWLVVLGNVSYSLYLWQFPILTAYVAAMFGLGFALTDLSLSTEIVTSSVITAALIALSCWSYRAVEIPSRRWVRDAFARAQFGVALTPTTRPRE